MCHSNEHENMNAQFKCIQFSADSKPCYLLKQIHKKLGSAFLTESVQKVANESSLCYEKAVQRYFKNRIIMDAVVKTSYSQNKHEEHMPSFYLNAIPKYAPQFESSLPFSSEHVYNVLKNRRMSKSDMEKYSILVENKIAEFYIKLSEYTGQSATWDWKKMFTKTLQYISTKSDHLDLKASEIRPQKLALQEMLSTYYTELIEGLTILKRIVNLFEKKYSIQLSLAETSYLDSQCLLLKMRAFEFKVLDMTYTNESLPALRIISRSLDGRKEILMNDRKKTLSALDAYMALGSEFIALAETYRQLTEKISQKKYAISSNTF